MPNSSTFTPNFLAKIKWPNSWITNKPIKLIKEIKIVKNIKYYSEISFLFLSPTSSIFLLYSSINF